MVFPFGISDESTRLKLPEIDSDPLSEYINANFIRVRSSYLKVVYCIVCFNCYYICIMWPKLPPLCWYMVQKNIYVLISGSFNIVQKRHYLNISWSTIISQCLPKRFIASWACCFVTKHTSNYSTCKSFIWLRFGFRVNRRTSIGQFVETEKSGLIKFADQHSIHCLFYA